MGQKLMIKVGFCEAVASVEHQDRLASLPPRLHLHLSGEYLSTRWMLIKVITHWCFPPELAASLLGTAQPVCVGWIRVELSGPSCYRYLPFFGTCYRELPFSVFATFTYLFRYLPHVLTYSHLLFLQPHSYFSSWLRVWPTSNSGSSRRRSMPC